MPPPPLVGVTLRIECVKKYVLSERTPSATTETRIATSGVTATTAAAYTRVVISRSVAWRRPSTTYDHAVCSTTNRHIATTRVPARPETAVRTASSAAPRRAAAR